MNYAGVADLPVTIESTSLTRHEAETSSDFTRVTTVVSLSGPSPESDSGSNAGPDADHAGDRTTAVGRGEDVTYEATDHDALAETGLPDLAGEYTIDSFSTVLDGVDLFPAGAPDRDVFRNYRRWAVESAALELALAQAGTDLASALDVDSAPVRFVTSTRLGEPPSIDRVELLRERVPDIEFKLDPTPSWDRGLVTSLAAFDDPDAVRILDLKGHYEGTQVDAPPDPDLYELVIDAFPDAVIEDPGLTDETRPLFADEAVRERVSWDAPIHGVDDVESLPWEPGWLNIKPSRFGSIESLFETIEYCDERDIRLYGGGQFELGIGRKHLQALASLAYPDGPNDVAPRAYNEPAVGDSLPPSPLDAPIDAFGMGNR